MPALGQNFTMVAGDTAEIDFSIFDHAGVPLDLTGAKIEWQMAWTASTPALVSKSTANGGVNVTNPQAGQLKVLLAHADTSGLFAGAYYHETKVLDSQGDVATAATGTVTLLPALIKS